MRILANGPHCEVIMTVFQFEGMSDELYEESIKITEEDLHSLKTIMENQAAAAQGGTSQ